MVCPLVNGIRDPLTVFFCLKKNIIDGVAFNPKGYKFNLELLIKRNWKKAREFPFSFHTWRNGESKFNIKEIFAYLHLIFHLYAYVVFTGIHNLFKN